MYSTDFSSIENLFRGLFYAKTEEEIDVFITKNHRFFKSGNWYPIGGTESNFSIIENQQSLPIASLVEKVTNSIDAILMKRCLEERINPKSTFAPDSMEAAIKRFYPNYKNWDLPSFRRAQAEEIQIVADGFRRNTSVIIYDNGEGQHPEEFENTFLSLMRGNKNEIHFVQGRYNMGGSGAIVFCGKKRYQLIGSKRYDNSGDFGFTLIREHPLTIEERKIKKNSWYEFLKIEGSIPHFPIEELDLLLFKRKFKTGTVIKLYSYQFPSGYAGFAQDLNQSINEFLFEPVLPIYTVDKKERYPSNKVLELDLFGLKRRLEEEKDYVEEWFSQEYEDTRFKRMKVTCYVFRAKQENKSVKDTKEDIRRRYFKNGMSVLFSMNGQVHGYFTSEFITRTLKFNLLKDYLLIHVDCTSMKYEFRKELFMASRDRIKHGDEANELREYLGKKLKKSVLEEINKRRKESIGLESEDTSELIKSFASNLPKNSDLYKLLQNTLKLEEKKEKSGKKEEKKSNRRQEPKPFNPQRFPSYFKFHNKKDGQIPVISIPQNGERVIKFDTDVENYYFDRTEESGNLQISLLNFSSNTNDDGNKQGSDVQISDILNIVKSSPQNGTIKIAFAPTKEIQVGEEVQIMVSLKGVGDDYFNEMVWVMISDPEFPSEEAKDKDDEDSDTIGLPELKKVEKKDWENLENNGISMNYSTVMFPVSEGDKIQMIYVNLDSQVYLNHRKKYNNPEQLIVAQKKYLASIYFHSLFLYIITKRKNYKLSQQSEEKDIEVTIDEYIRELFDGYYSDFLLNFGMEQLINALEE